MNTAETLYRLHGLLPLKDRQQRLSREEEACHQAILLSFVEQGRALTASEIASRFDQSDAKVFLSRLSEKDLVVLGKRGEVIGAYPFTLEETPHRLTVNGHWVHAMCALDALAVSSMFACEVRIDSFCAQSGKPIHIRQRNKTLLQVEPSDQLLLGIHWQPVAGCAAHSLCREMVFLQDLEAAMAWQQTDPEPRELFELQEAVQIAAEFFEPLMQEETA